MNFAVLMCYAVPALKRDLKLISAGTLPSLEAPDYFTKDKSTPTTLHDFAKNYKGNLASYLWLANFSFFEAFISDAIKEMVEFHGGIQPVCR